MNKKLVLSVLSTAVLTSMAASAMAAPSGYYVGGNVDKIYSTDFLIKNFKEASKDIMKNPSKTVFVDEDGKAVNFMEAMLSDKNYKELLKPATKSMFEDNEYVNVATGEKWDPKKEEWPEVPGDLTVESVSANNLKEVVVTFDKNVDVETAEAPNNYTLNGGLKVASAKADGKTVVLTLEENADQQGTYELTVDGVKGLVKTVKEVKFFDNTTPTVAAVSAVGPKQVKVTFSEPLKAKPNFSVNEGAIAVVGDNFAAGTKEVTLTLGAQPTASTNTVTVDGGSDYAGYKVEKVTKNFSVVVDTTPPTVSVKKASATQVVLVFSEDVENVLGNTNVEFYHTAKGTPAYKGTVVSATGKEATINFNNPLPEGQFKIFVEYAIDNGTQISDLWGNKLPEQVITGTFTADTTAPTVTKVEAKSNTQIQVTFSEAVSGAENKANYTLKDVTGAVIPLNKAEVVDAAKNIYQVVTSAPLNGGSYSLTIKGIEDASKNKLVDYTTNVSVADTVPPNVKDLDTSKDGFDAQLISPKKVKVAFTEPMDKASIENKNNYLYKGVNLDSKVTVTATDSNTAVVFDFTNVVGFTGFDDESVIHVGRVLDVAGNPIATMQTPVKVPNSVSAPLFDKAEVTGKKTVKLYFKELITNAKADDFQVDNGEGYADVVAISNDVVDNKSVITLTTSKELPTTAAGVKVKTVGTVDAKNQYDVPVSLTDVAAADKFGPEWVSVKTVDTNNNGKIDAFELTFSEALYVASVQDSDFTVEGYTISGVETKGAVVTIKVEELDIDDSDATPAVAVIGTVEDVKRNASGPFEAKNATDGVSAPDTEAPVVTGVEDGQTYDAPVTPASEATDIDTVELKKDDLVVEGYELGTEITENGVYVLTVTDKAGNKTVVHFTVDIQPEA